MWPFSKSVSTQSDLTEDAARVAFENAVEREFGPIAQECGSSLKQVDVCLFGFCTPYAVLTIGAYPGHYRSICVKLRSREDDIVPSVRDEADIGLANIDKFMTGHVSEVFGQNRAAWAPGPIALEVAQLATKTRELGMPFLQSRAADWSGLREMIALTIEAMAREKGPDAWGR